MPEQGRMVDAAEMHKVGKQIRLPWSKAIEIAAKSMKIRFGRSLVTTASIILAIAFLMSILTGTTLVTAMKTRPAALAFDLRERAERAKEGKVDIPFPADATAEATQQEVRQLKKQLAPETLGALKKRLLQAELAAAEAQAAVLQATGDRDKALANWRILRARADAIRADNKWQELVRVLLAEGYTDVKPEITSRPQAMSFIGMLRKQMDPRDKWLAALASLVCFVGIWNAMLMSVHERFREIGTMKCLGALESFIIKLYFLESSFIGLVGTLLGIGIGFVLSMVRAVYVFGFGTVFDNFDFGGAAWSALGTLLIGSFLSVGAAIFPARSAARMDPVVAMRADE